MQTFLPYSDFHKSLFILDYRRLGKQRVEALTLINVIQNTETEGEKPKGWVNHPITIMWTPYLDALKLYCNLSIQEWIRRGYNNTIPLFEIDLNKINYPDWLGFEPFHASHRANLLRKDMDYYAQFGWNDNPESPYLWRDSNKRWYSYDSKTKKRIYLSKDFGMD